jgi:hypothetical protein
MDAEGGAPRVPVGWRVSLSVLATLLLLVFPAAAQANSAGATVRTLPESSNVEVHVEFQHECGSEFCVWGGRAAAYSASVGCPGTLDPSHEVWWSGPIDVSSTSGSFALNPAGLGSVIQICLYYNSEELVGESHPFDLNAGREVLPPPEPRRSPARTSVRMTVHRCQILPHVAVNGETNIGGNITWALYRVGRHGRLTRLFTATYPEESGFEAGEEPNGTYRFNVRFLGDENLLPSAKAASVVFRVRHC